jgi:hypothetical protein
MGRLARAAVVEDRYFVFFYCEGGWDLLMGLDPRDPSIFTDAVVSETGIQPAYDRLGPSFSHEMISAGSTHFGPAIGELAERPELFSVVRGIDMATLTHEVGRRYFLTGRPPSGNLARGSSVATLAAAGLSEDRPVPHLAVQMESYAESHLPSYAGALSVASVAHLPFVLQEDLGLATLIRPGVREAIAAYQQRDIPCSETGVHGTHLADLYRENQARAEALVASGLHLHFDFGSAETAAVREHYGFEPGQQDTPYGRAALAAQAIKTGLSRVVSVQLTAGLDTHDGSWANDHGPRLQAGFDGLARLLTDLEGSEADGGGSLLEKTTIVVFSEFGRTPRLNARGGRDHMLTNSAILAGAGIKGGVVVGGSSDVGMGPLPVDLTTGLPSADGVGIGPEHVMSTLLATAGIDGSDLRSEPLPTLLA